MAESHSTSVPAVSQGGEPPWEVIAERVDDFAAAWDAALAADGEPPAMGEFAAELDPAAARHVLVELAKLDIERRHQHEKSPRQIEWYAGQFPALGPVAELPADLIYEELQARMAGGRPVYQEEIAKRFPAQADSLLRLLGGMAFSGTPTATYYADTVVDPKAPPRPRSTIAPFVKLQPGDQLDDFQLLTPLGSGAFARVFLARQVSMERMVALKISAHTGSEPQTLAQLDHPHIVRVYDQRQCTDPPARLLYMEVVSGGTLHDVITRARATYDGQASGLLLLNAIDERLGAVGAPIPESSSSRDWIAEASWPEVVCRLGAELAEGLAYAHSRGVLHRDIKPANVLLSGEGRPKLADFNVSYNGGRSDENPEDTFGGSLAYMSPEQLQACHPLLGGSPRDVREPSDVYALGVMLWELLAGRRPFRDEALPADGGGSLVRLQRMIESRERADFAQLAEQLPTDCPASFREVLAKCLSPRTEDRFRTADELSRALRLCLNPRCWRLLQPPQSRLGKFILNWPKLSVVLAALVPNIMTAAFNLVYNWMRFRTEPSLMPLEARFETVQYVINSIAFPVGIGWGAWAASKRLAVLRPPPPADALAATGRVLGLGQFVALMLLALWSVSGIAFPIAIGWNVSSGHGFGFYLHFFLSLALCGIASTAYPYMLITAMAVMYYVPELVRRGIVPGPRKSDLQTVTKLNALYLALSAMVPMLGTLLVVVSGQRQDWVIITATGGGLAGFAAMWALERKVRFDVAALMHIAVEERRRSGNPRSGQGSGVSDRRSRSSSI